jgi:nucleotidyltransferase substrate binding protein (TIGR01987 family)
MTNTRWQQRHQNYKLALSQLESAVALNKTRELSDLENQGLIQAFEYSYELAWNVIKDFYTYQGVTDIQGSRDAFRLAFNRGLVQDGDVWMSMIKSRALTSHTYNKTTAEQVISAIKQDYLTALKILSDALDQKLDKKVDQQLDSKLDKQP